MTLILPSCQSGCANLDIDKRKARIAEGKKKSPRQHRSCDSQTSALVPLCLYPASPSVSLLTGDLFSGCSSRSRARVTSLELWRKQRLEQRPKGVHQFQNVSFLSIPVRGSATSMQGPPGRLTGQQGTPAQWTGSVKRHMPALGELSLFLNTC